MKAEKTASIVFIFMLVLSLVSVNRASSLLSRPTIISLDPPQIIDTANTPSNFTVNINISYVAALNNWEVKIRYNPVLLYTNSSLIKEGPFLKSGGPTVFSVYLETDYIDIGCLILSYNWASGSGILANVTFVVEKRGETLLDLFDTNLANVDVNGNPIPVPNTSQNGYFRNIDSSLIPEARFVYYAQTYNVTFNASSSYSPDSTIQTYTWVWGGSSLDSIRQSTTTYPTMWHDYPEAIPPPTPLVRLIVTDYKNVTSNILMKLITIGVSIHDVALTAIESSPTNVLIGNYSSTAISVNITNYGNQLENTNVTISYNSTYFDFHNITATQWTTLQTQPVDQLAGFENRTILFVWNTTGFPPSYYAIKAEASPVLGETNTSNNMLIGLVRIVTVLLAPIAIFKYYPSHPQAGQQVVFNASQSYDPDGTIISYSWDFGDSSQLLTSQNSTSHIYEKGGAFNVTLTVTDDDKIQKHTTVSIVISKLESAISFSISSSIVVVNSSATIKGVLSSNQSGANITILYRLFGQYFWNILANTETNSNGLFSYSWKPSASGTYEFKAEWDGDQKYVGASSNVVMATAKFSSNLSLSVDQLSATVGQTIKISGNVTPARFGAVVTILYRQGDGSCSVLARTLTDESGAYKLNWTPNTAGTYEFKAEWDGDDQSLGAESSLTAVTVTESLGVIRYLPYALIAAAAIALAIVLFWVLRKPSTRRK